MFSEYPSDVSCDLVRVKLMYKQPFTNALMNYQNLGKIQHQVFHAGPMSGVPNEIGTLQGVVPGDIAGREIRVFKETEKKWWNKL